MTAIPLNVTENSYPWTTISPVVVVQGDAKNFNVNLAYADTVASSGVSNALYKDGKVVTNPASPLTGSPSATGNDNNVVTSLLATTLQPGEYVLHVAATVDGLVGCACQILLTVLAKGKAL